MQVQPLRLEQWTFGRDILLFFDQKSNTGSLSSIGKSSASVRMPCRAYNFIQLASTWYLWPILSKDANKLVLRWLVSFMQKTGAQVLCSIRHLGEKIRVREKMPRSKRPNKPMTHQQRHFLKQELDLPVCRISICRAGLAFCTPGTVHCLKHTTWKANQFQL